MIGKSTARITFLACITLSFFAQGMENREQTNRDFNNLRESKEKLEAATLKLNQALATFFSYLGQVNTNRGPKGPLTVEAFPRLVEIEALIRLKEASLNLRWGIIRSLTTRNLNSYYRFVLKAAFDVGMLQLSHTDLLDAYWQGIQERINNREVDTELVQAITERLERQKRANKGWFLVGLQKLLDNLNTASVFDRETGFSFSYDFISGRELQELYEIEEDIHHHFAGEHLQLTAEVISELITEARNSTREARERLEEAQMIGRAMRESGMLQEKSSCVLM